MKYVTEYDADTGICTVTVTGRHRRPDDSVELQQYAREFGSKNDCSRFLVDMTQAEIVGSTMDAYKTGTVPGDTDNKQGMQRVALVYAGDIREHKFLENVAVNRGYQVRVFDRIDIATEWLTTHEQGD